MRDLLSEAEEPDCVTNDGLCSCTLLWSGQYGLMYNSNSPDSIAEYFIDSNYCYKGSTSGNWTRDNLMTIHCMQTSSLVIVIVLCS